MNWTEMKLFKGIDLNDSFVLSWKQTPNELLFELEASVWPESKYYEKPTKDEYTCYKPATLVFHNIRRVSGLLNISQVKTSLDASGEADYGNIDSLEQVNGGFSLKGDFGSVSIEGGSLSFEVKKT